MKTKSENFISCSEIPWEIIGKGLARRIMGYDGQIMLVQVKFEKGAVGSVHQHYHSQTTFVVSGKFEVTIKGEKMILLPGDGFYIEPDAPHGAVCIESGLLIDVFSPMREEFIK